MSPCGQWARPATICAVVAAVLLQLGLMTALYNVESDAAAAMQMGANGASSSAGAPAREYCIMSGDVSSLAGNANPALAGQVNAALAQGCTLVGQVVRRSVSEAFCRR